MKKIAFLALILLLPANHALAQVPERPDYELVLLPLNVKNIPGAHGSVWTSVFTIFNAGTSAAKYYPEGITCPFTCLPPNTLIGEIAPLRTLRPDTNFGPPQRGPGALFYLERTTADQIGVSLRSQDLSRQSETFGTEIPVVRENELKNGELYLSTAPPLAGFRQMLRIYEVDRPPSAEFFVQFFNHDGEVVNELVVSTRWPEEEAIPAGFYSSPGYAEVPGLELLLPPDQMGGRGASVIIRPMTEGVRYWGFVSVTHDQTQHVTILTPQ
ncbi:MAG TPA: hypothetical protein VMS12_13585 [Thermoanaerobaculia bacterium]|nr:hypothetical protein [Thermoanaerobaculia bacterium]